MFLFVLHLNAKKTKTILNNFREPPHPQKKQSVILTFLLELTCNINLYTEYTCNNLIFRSANVKLILEKHILKGKTHFKRCIRSMYI